MSWRLRMSSVNPVTMSWQTFGTKILWSGCVRCLLQDEDHSVSRPHLFLVFQFCVPERSWNGSGVRRYLCVKINSSNLDRAPKMRDYVLRNSWGSFLVTLPSISSKTCVIYSSLILGTDVFRDWPFLGCSSCVSLVTAANFRLFLNVAIFLKGKCYAVMKTELYFIC